VIGTDPAVAYTWGYGLSGSAAAYARLEKITLPGGRQIYYNYEDANAFMSLGRVGDIADGSSGGRTKYVAYSYLGASMVVDANHPAVPTGLRLTLDPNADKTYWGFDRLGRVIDQKWASAGSAADRFAYTYGRSSNRMTRSQALKTAYNETYHYDFLDRLKQADRAGDANSLYAQAAKLLASDGAAGDNLGSCVALDGDLAIVGAPGADPNSVSNSGAAYVFHKGDDGWRQVAKLVANDPNADDNFGKAVAISGQTVLVGSPNADPNGSNSGAAYVFNCTSGAGWQWQQAAKLVASDGAASNYFGNAVAIDGSRIVIGAHGRDSSKGAAYVFEHSDANGWQEKCKLPSGTLNASDYFGFSVSLDGNTAVSGAYGDDQAADAAGAAYVFRYSGTSWSLEQKLTAGDAAASDAFGRSVSISGDKVVVSAPMDDYDSKSNVGSAYVFSRSGSTWSQQKQLKASDGAAGDWFGGMAPPISPAAVSIDGNTVWVGAPGRDDNGGGSGSAYAFGDPNLGQAAKLLATDGAAGDYMGNSVCVRGNTAIVGAYGDDDAGAAYVFRDANTALSQSWSLDPRGNWTSSTTNGTTQTRTHDNSNQITSMSGVSLAPLYDQAGSNVRGPRPADPNANNAAHFRYDAWNRLATIHLDDGGTSGTLDANDSLLATYRYDGLNRRVMKAVDVDGNSVTDYMYHNENWQIVEVRRGVNQTPTAAAYKQFVWDIRYIDAPVCRWWDKDSDGTMEPAAGEMQYFTNDGNFNTTALVDANSGSVVERYLYDPYGKVTVLNGAADADPNVAEWSPDADNKSDWDNEILFCGYWYDPETGLFHVRERYYDPLTGTWKTRDRILYPDGMNLYEYVNGSPVDRADAVGLKWSQTTANVDGTETYKWTPWEESDTWNDLLAEMKTRYKRTYTLSSAEWVCIRPLPDEVTGDKAEITATQNLMRDNWGKGKPAKCGVYDVGNLVDGWNTADTAPEFRGVVASYEEPTWDPADSLKVADPGAPNKEIVFYKHSMGNEFGYDMDHILWPGGQNVIKGQGNAMANSIGLAATAGNNPLRHVTLIGHSRPGFTVIRYKPISGPSFGIQNLRSVDGSGSNGATSYDLVTKKNAMGDNNVLSRFPRICWFRHDAEIRLVGCDTRDAAGDFAKILRSGAKAVGTSTMIYTFMEPNGTFTVGVNDRRKTSEGQNDYWWSAPPMYGHVKSASDFYALSIWAEAPGALR